MALALDASTPAIAVNTSTTVATVTTGSFTPPSGSLILVRWSGDTATSPPATPSITDNLGVHLTYAPTDWQSSADSPVVNGQSATWWAVVGTSAAMTITVTSGTVSGHRASSLCVSVITGQHATTPIGTTSHGKAGSASATSIAQNFTGTAANSWGFIGVTDWDALGTMTAGTGMTTTTGGASTIAGQISYGFLSRTTADGTNGGTTTLNVTIPGTSTALNWTYVEVIPVAGAATATITPYEFVIPPTLLYELILEHQRRTLPASTAPDQQVADNGIPSGERLGSPTITTTVTIAVNGIVGNEKVGNATVASSVTPQAIPGAENLGSPTVTTTYTISASGITSSERFGSQLIAQTVNPQGIVGAETVGSPVVSVVVSANGISGSEQLGSPTITTTVTVAVNGIVSGEASGNASTATATSVNPNGIPGAERLGSPTITTTYTINANGIPSTEISGNPSLTLNVNANGIPSAESFGLPTEQVIVSINASGIQSTERLGSPTLTTTYTINANGITSSELSGNSNITTASSVTPQGITGGERVGQPAVTTTYSVTAGGISSTEIFGATATGYNVLANGVTSNQAVGNPSLLVVVAINSNSIASGEQVGSPTVTTTYNIIAQGIPTAERFGLPSLAPTSSIQPGSITSTERFGAITITTGSITIAVSGVPGASDLGFATVTLGIPGQHVLAFGIITEVKLGRPFIGEQAIVDVSWRDEPVVVYVADPPLSSTQVVDFVLAIEDDVVDANGGPDEI